MVHGKKFLQSCRQLSEKGIRFDFLQGAIVARAFADLGIEEFILLTPNKICSLYSGQVSQLPEEEKKHFFAVPDSGQMLDHILKSGKEILSLIYEEQRCWKLDVKNENSENTVFYGNTIEEAFINCLLGDEARV